MKSTRTINPIIIFISIWIVSFFVYWIGMKIKFSMYEMSAFGKFMYHIGLYAAPTILAALITFMSTNRR